MLAKKRYEVGLQKLQFTEQQVVLMQEELTALKPNLIKTVAETERLMATVQKEKTEVGGRDHEFASWKKGKGNGTVLGRRQDALAGGGLNASRQWCRRRRPRWGAGGKEWGTQNWAGLRRIEGEEYACRRQM